MKYEIWITDKSGIPTFIKEYPYKIQCWTWALMNGYIYRGKHWYFGNSYNRSDSKIDFDEALALRINDLWQDLTESEQEQIRSILNG